MEKQRDKSTDAKPPQQQPASTPATDPNASPRTDVEGDDVDRPSLYQHKPQKRFDEFDRVRMEGTQFLDALRLQSFEGCDSRC